MSEKNKVRYAVAGQGYISQVAVLPAFKNAKENSELAAIISDDPVKLEALGRKYDAERTYSYDQYDECLRDVDAVYIALPNHMHREYTERAARAGVHVLCEKPMAVSEQDCESMIRVCEENRVRLMIAYRLHFEEANLKAVDIAQSGKIGEARIFSSVFSQQVEEGNIRLASRELGGGALYDIGIYCINAARYLFQAEPEEVFSWTATNGERRFSQCEEMAAATLRFAGGRLASFTCSFGASDVSSYRLVGTKGDLRVDPAYEFAGELKHYLTIDGKTRETTFSKRDQFAPQLIYFSDCVLEGRDPEPSGVEGLADVRVIRALYRSAESGRPEKLPPFQPKARPNLSQEMKKPAVGKPDLVNAKSPSGE